MLSVTTHDEYAHRRSRDLAYANAMREVMKRDPGDVDAGTLFAEALMDTMRWDYYTEDRRPKAVTEELISALEFVIAKDPSHPGANDYYIHAVEASPYPESIDSELAVLRRRAVPRRCGWLVQHYCMRVRNFDPCLIQRQFDPSHNTIGNAQHICLTRGRPEENIHID
jgi:hypothetical protein